MTRELARALDEEFAALTPPTDITGELIARKGRRVRVRRRFAYGGGVLAGAAALALLLSGTPTGIGRQALPVAEPSPRPTVEQPDFPLPPIDPDAHYVWGDVFHGEPTAETEIVDAAWLSAVEAIEGAALYSPDRESGRWTALTEGDHDPVLRSQRDLMMIDPENESHTLHPEGGRYNPPFYTGGEIALDFDADQWADVLTLGVYAKGSYLRGAVARFGTFPMEPGPQLVAGCADRTAEEEDYQVVVHYTCTDSTGPNGEQILTVESTSEYSEGVVEHDRQVVLYRNDGTAVVVADRIRDIADDASGLGGAGKEFALTAAELLELALAVPSVVVM